MVISLILWSGTIFCVAQIISTVTWNLQLDTALVGLPVAQIYVSARLDWRHGIVLTGLSAVHRTHADNCPCWVGTLYHRAPWQLHDSHPIEAYS
jgi:hypothetical protein